MNWDRTVKTDVNHTMCATFVKEGYQILSQGVWLTVTENKYLTRHGDFYLTQLKVAELEDYLIMPCDWQVDVRQESIPADDPRRLMLA